MQFQPRHRRGDGASRVSAVKAATVIATDEDGDRPERDVWVSSGDDAAESEVWVNESSFGEDFRTWDAMTPHSIPVASVYAPEDV